MSNGIKLNFKQSDNEPRAAMLRIVAAGGRACEGEPCHQLNCSVRRLTLGVSCCWRGCSDSALLVPPLSRHPANYEATCAQDVSRDPMAREWSASARGR